MDLRDISINAMCEPYLHLDLNKVLKKKKRQTDNVRDSQDLPRVIL